MKFDLPEIETLDSEEITPIKLLKLKFDQYLELPVVSKITNKVELWQITYRSRMKLKMLSEYIQLSEIETLDADQTKHLNALNKSLSIKTIAQKTTAILSRLNHCILTLNKQFVKDPIGFGFVWNKISIYHVNRWKTIEEEQFLVFLMNEVARSIDFDRTEISITSLQKEVYTSFAVWHNLTSELERKNNVGKIAFADKTYHVHRKSNRATKHNLKDYIISSVDGFLDDIQKLSRYKRSEILEYTKENAPYLHHYINSSFANFIDFINLCEHVVLAISEVKQNPRAFYIIGQSRAGKSTLIDLLKYCFPDFCTDINIRDAFNADPKIRGQQLHKVGSKTLLCEYDMSPAPVIGEFFKKGVDNENVTIEIKYKNVESYQYNPRYLIASNHPLYITEAGHQIKVRLQAIRLIPQSKDNIDPDLKNNLFKEKNEIIKIMFALGMPILKRKSFDYTYNENSEELVKQITANPITEFVDTLGITFNENPSIWVKKEALYNAFKTLVKENGYRRSPNKSKFQIGLEHELRAPKSIYGSKNFKIKPPGQIFPTSNFILIDIKEEELFNELAYGYEKITNGVIK